MGSVINPHEVFAYAEHITEIDVNAEQMPINQSYDELEWFSPATQEPRIIV